MFLILFADSAAKYQDSTHTAGQLRLKRYELVIGSGLAFSLVDYLGYNIFVTSNPAKKQQNFLLHVFDATLMSPPLIISCIRPAACRRRSPST